MPSIGPLEILEIAVIALIVFGPERLPDIARKIGRGASQLRRAAADVREEFDIGFDLDEEDEDERPTRRARPSSKQEPEASKTAPLVEPPAEAQPASSNDETA